MSGSLLFLLLLCLFLGWANCATKCFRNEDLGDADGNVYYCYGDEKPECCEENSQFTCCESQGSKNAREQAQLWGTVAALVIIIGLLFVCCKNDYSLCNGDDRTLADRMGLSRRPEPTMPRLSRPGEGRQFRDGHSYPYSNLPPLPPMTPLPDRNEASSRADRLYPSLDSEDKKPEAKYDGRNYNPAFLPDDEDYRY